MVRVYLHLREHPATATTCTALMDILSRETSNIDSSKDNMEALPDMNAGSSGLCLTVWAQDQRHAQRRRVDISVASEIRQYYVLSKI